MAHRIYDSEAIILGSTPAGESNQYVALLTKELGLLRAVARSSRSSHSKLRYALQKYGESEVSLVRGKDVWRLVGAVSKKLHHPALRGEKEKRLVVGRVTKLLERLHGEEPHLYLYESLHSFYETLDQEHENSAFEAIELITVLRLLYALGYVRSDATTEKYITDATLSPELLGGLTDDKKALLERVNQSLSVSLR